jgi:KDO2-lipid IV(A) lauroyltransferase
MNFLIYLFVYPFIWLFSILPFKVLYFISDILFLILYYIVGYRKTVVLNNLKLAFPKKNNAELLKIRKQFYKHFVDVFIEILKTFTVSKEEIYKRYTFTNVDMLNELYKDGKSLILVGPHYANWEWIMSLDTFAKFKGYAAYSKINNNYFNQKVLNSRAKFGTHLIQTSHIISEIELNSKNNTQAAYGLLSDQSPQLNKTFYWSEFLNVKVPIHTGAEMLTKKYNMNMIFIDTKKIKRGHYSTTFSLINTEAKIYPDYELTDIFLRKVEEKIEAAPEYYLWTHKRFKHMNKEEITYKQKELT